MSSDASSPAPAAAPRSAAYFGLNTLGLAAGLLALWATWQWSAEDSIITLLVSCAAVAAVIAGGELLLGVRKRSSTGLAPAALRPISWLDTSLRMLGFALTLATIAFVYWVFPEYHGAFYEPFWKCLWRAGVPALVLSPLYFAWAGARLQEPRDAFWQLGSALTGRLRLRQLDARVLKAHLLSWIVKAFFLPLMVVYLDGEVRMLAHVSSEAMRNFNGSESFAAEANRLLFSNGMSLYHFFYELAYSIDLLFCVVGYSVTLRALDSQIRSTEPTLFGWLVALLCYQPFFSVIGAYYLHYDDDLYWDNWLLPFPILRGIWATVIIVLLFVYGFSTVSFGLRFSNLTYRGIITSGPYRYSRHPAYLSKNLSWWLISVPWVSNQSWDAALRNCLALGLINLVYFLRARTEERHLSRDPDYVAYALWINEHGLLSRLGRVLPFLRYRPPAGFQPLGGPAPRMSK